MEVRCCPSTMKSILPSHRNRCFPRVASKVLSQHLQEFLVCTRCSSTASSCHGVCPRTMISRTVFKVLCVCPRWNIIPSWDLKYYFLWGSQILFPLGISNIFSLGISNTLSGGLLTLWSNIVAYLALLGSRRKGDEHLGKSAPERLGSSAGAECGVSEDAVKCHKEALDDSGKQVGPTGSGWVCNLDHGPLPPGGVPPDLPLLFLSVNAWQRSESVKRVAKRGGE
jgi:hypothetical protein